MRILLIKFKYCSFQNRPINTGIFNYNLLKVKVTPRQFLYRPRQALEGSRRQRLPDFMTIST